MRAAAIASMLCLAGCRQLLGFDSPSIGDARGDGADNHGSDSGSPDSSDAAGSSAYFVQGNSAEGTSTVSVMLTNIATGDVLIVAASSTATFAAFPSDSDGNAYSAIIGNTTANGFLQLYEATAASSTHADDTITLSTATGDPIELVVAEYRRVQAMPTDGEVGSNGNSAQLKSGQLTTANPSDVLVAVGASISALSAEAPFTRRVVSPLMLTVLEDRVVTAAGTYEATEVASGSGLWLMSMVALETR